MLTTGKGSTAISLNGFDSGGDGLPISGANQPGPLSMTGPSAQLPEKNRRHLRRYSVAEALVRSGWLTMARQSSISWWGLPKTPPAHTSATVRRQSFSMLGAQACAGSEC